MEKTDPRIKLRITRTAGSAVAVDRNFHLVYSYGFPEPIARQRALQSAEAKVASILGL
jgi:hypothetical protein